MISKIISTKSLNYGSILTRLGLEKTKPINFPKRPDYGQFNIEPKPNLKQEDHLNSLPSLNEIISHPDDLEEYVARAQVDQENDLKDKYLHIDSDEAREYADREILTKLNRLPAHLMRKYRGEPPALTNFSQTRRDVALREWAMYGSKSGVDPSIAWPEPEEMREEMKIREFQGDLNSQLKDRIEELKKWDKDFEKKKKDQMAVVQKEMAKMPKLITKYLEQRHAMRMEKKSWSKKDETAIDEARELFGYEPQRNEPLFQRFKALKKLEEKAAAGRLRLRLSRKQSLRQQDKSTDSQLQERIATASAVQALEAQKPAAPGDASKSSSATAGKGKTS